jgi:hypothetical protein
VARITFIRVHGPFARNGPGAFSAFIGFGAVASSRLFLILSRDPSSFV